MTHRINIIRQGRGEPVTFVHGWGMNGSVFQPLLPELKGRYRVCRLDLPGYGGSEPGRSGFDDQVEQLASVIDDGDLVAWSMGGLFAIALAHRYPQKFRRLMLISSNPCFVQRADWPQAMDAAVFNAFAEDLIADWQATIRRFIGLQMHGADNARVLIRQISALLVAGGQPHPDVLRFGLDLLLGLDLRPLLSELSLPITVVLGRRDKLVPYALAGQLPVVNPGIRVKCMLQSSHAPFLSHQQEFLEVFNEFVKSSAAG